MRRNVLWLSRHEPTEPQIKELKRILGNVNINHISATVKDVDDVLSLMREHHIDELVAVLPLSLIADLTRKGVQPLRAVMHRQLLESGDVKFTFDYFERIERGVEIVSTPL
jgi:hypothetical protein